MAARGAARGITLASTMQKTALREYTNLYLMLTATAKRTCTAAPSTAPNRSNRELFEAS